MNQKIKLKSGKSYDLNKEYVKCDAEDCNNQTEKRPVLSICKECMKKFHY